MNWEAIGAIGELVGALVVVMSFLYLGRQIRLSTRQQRMEGHRAMAELQLSTNRVFYDPGLTRAITRTLHDWQSASFDDQNVTRQWITDTVTHYQALFEMWRQGAIDDQVWDAEETFLTEELLATNGGQGFWEENAILFNDNFRLRIEPRIADTPLGLFNRAYARLVAEESC